jgi:hypothetical protein
MGGETSVVLLAGETLLLGRGDDASLLDQRRRAVVIEGRNAENAHMGVGPTPQKMV